MSLYICYPLFNQPSLIFSRNIVFKNTFILFPNRYDDNEGKGSCNDRYKTERANKDEKTQKVMTILKGNKQIEKGTLGREEAQTEIQSLTDSELCTTDSAPSFMKTFKLPTGLEDNMTVEVFFSPLHLAVIYDSKLVLSIVYQKMQEDVEFFKKALSAKVTHDKDFDDKYAKYLECVAEDPSLEFIEVDDQIFQPTLLHLAIKYNHEVLKRILEIGKQHQLSAEDLETLLLKAHDSRKVNVPHFAAMQPTPKCLE